jgi:hypothetical protein
MSRKTNAFRHLITVALLGWMANTAAQAETVNCTPINSLPAVISSQGVYCLTGNLATNTSSGSAIEITANNVTLDLNGWKVGGQAAGTTTRAYGINSLADNVTIKNGIVRGFYDGIYLAGRGAVVEDMLIDQNTHLGIWVNSYGAVVRRNQIVDTGGSTYYIPTSASGIIANNVGASIEDNVISGLTSTGSGQEIGIYMDNSKNSTVRHNIITDDAKPTGGGQSIGIYAGNAFITVVDNAITNFNLGIAYTNPGPSLGVYSRNTVVDCDTPFSGGTAGTGNDHD